MARFVSGEVVVVPFPFTDLSSSKVRPALVLASLTRGDLILCQITSQSGGHPEAVPSIGGFRGWRRAAAPKLRVAASRGDRQ